MFKALTADRDAEHGVGAAAAPRDGRGLLPRRHPRLHLPPGDARQEATGLDAGSSESLKINFMFHAINVPNCRWLPYINTRK